jgi:hypothetical protein
VLRLPNPSAPDRGKMKRRSLSIHPGTWCFPALFAALLLLLVIGSPLAADRPAGSAPATTDNVANPEAPAATDNVANPEAPTATANGWVDRTHSWVQKGMSGTVIWFDRFFGDERMVVIEPPEAYLRWKTELRWDEEEGYSFRSAVRASLRLPRLKNRWHLVFTSESRGDPNSIIPEDPGNPGLDPGSQVRTASMELVYDILRTQRSLLDAGVGVRVKIPPNAIARMRFQHARAVGFSTLGRFTATAYWDALDGPGESNQLDFERWLAPPTMLRWSNSFTIEEKNKDNGWAWGTQLSLLHKLSPKSAITFATGVSGSTRPAWIAQNYQVLARYRRNVWREWLFLEGEPYINWPRKEDGSQKPVWGATLRAEILFAGVGPFPQDGGGNKP